MFRLEQIKYAASLSDLGCLVIAEAVAGNKFYYSMLNVL